MTTKQTEIIYDLVQTSSISPAHNYVLVESAVAELIKSDEEIFVKFNNNHKLIELTSYELKSIKLITTIMPCDHLIKIINEGN